MGEKRDRVIDALNATRAAVELGIVVSSTASDSEMKIESHLPISRVHAFVGCVNPALVAATALLHIEVIVLSKTVFLHIIESLEAGSPYCGHLDSLPPS